MNMQISGITCVSRRPRHKRKRKALLVLIVLLIVLSVSVFVISLIDAFLITHPKKIDVQDIFPSNLPKYKEVNFKDINNQVSLSGWYFSSDASDKTVILAHGYHSNRLQFGAQTADIINSLLNNEYNFFTFDFRGSGKSDKAPFTFGLNEKNDLLGAINYIKNQNQKHIILLGYSSGAVASILASENNTDIEALILDSAYSDVKEYLKARSFIYSRFPIKAFITPLLYSTNFILDIDLSTVNILEAIKNIPTKNILFIHSQDDNKVSIHESEILKRASSGTTDMWITTGTNHLESFNKYPAAYIRNIETFINSIFIKKAMSKEVYSVYP